VCNVVHYGDHAVAEHAFALIMELTRQVGRLDAQVRRGDWGGIDGIGLHGKKLGLVGFGGIGRTVARIANGFGMKTLVWNSHVHGIDGLDITLIDDMDEVFAQSDIMQPASAAARRHRRHHHVSAARPDAPRFDDRQYRPRRNH
jgi:phosphoglycerate dehydrogenase-like enzyme